MTESINPPLYQKIIATPKEVSERIHNLAIEVVERYGGQRPLFVCLLRGGAPFAVQLMRDIADFDPHFHPEMDYMTVSTYASERTDSEPKLVMGLAPHTEVAGRTVVLIDDTLDKGITADFARQQLLTSGAHHVDLIAMVEKQRDRIGRFFESATLAAFSFPGEAWLTGMGLDDTRIAKEANRWTGYIAIAVDDM